MVEVPISWRLTLALSPALAGGLGCLLCWLAARFELLTTDLTCWLTTGLGCLLASVIGQLPVAASKQFDIQKIAGQLMVSLTLRSCLTVLALLAIVRGGIADWQLILLPFVAWYATLMVVDLTTAIRFITRFAPAQPDTLVVGAGERQSS